MSTDVRAGHVVAGFRVVSMIGEGATGTVYLADEPTGDRKVALKLLTPDLARDERFRRRFLRETELAAKLDHPNVVRTLASGNEDGTLYLAMEYVEGRDLRDVLRREGRLEPDRAVGVLTQVAAALDTAHEAGLVHRDVKPANVLISTRRDGDRAYVCDFGLARHISSASSLTTDSGFVGTIDYVPPEQVEGGQIDGRADVYSLGCVLFECLAGTRPFDRDSELAVVFAHLNEPPPRPSEIRPHLPKALDTVLEVALAKSPDDRYSSCAELIEAARAALAGKTVTRPRRRRRRYLAAGAVALLVAAGAATIGVVVTRGGSSSPKATAVQRPPEITQTSIAGARLGRPARYYKKRFGGWRAAELTQTHYPTLAFQQREVAVYFPAKGKPAHILTTWNRTNKTAQGIGPCSTLAQMRKVYGNRVTATWAGSSPNGKVHWSWALGRNLLFMTQDRKTIADVVLYEGVPVEKHGGSPQDYANYVGAVETACK